jgi:hypothetical protein
MLLDSGDNHSPERRAAFNIALSHFNIAVRESPGAVPDAQPSWSVSEGHRLTRFTDGMKIASRGPLTANRAAVLLAAYGEGCFILCSLLGHSIRLCTAAYRHLLMVCSSAGKHGQAQLQAHQLPMHSSMLRFGSLSCTIYYIVQQGCCCLRLDV